MKIFFDTEFTGLIKNTELISIGCITEKGNVFYAEFNDYNKTLINPWIKKNVVDNLIHPERSFKEKDVYVEASFEEINKVFLMWLNIVREKEEKIQFVSDCASYDSVLLFDLLSNHGSALDIPSFISPIVDDIVYKIQEYIENELEETKDSLTKAFDFNREELLFGELGCEEYLDESMKHNALYDAKIIYHLYKLLKK